MSTKVRRSFARLAAATFLIAGASVAAHAATLEDVRKAWDARDPRLITLIEQLCNQPVPPPETPLRDGALTFDKFLTSLRDWRFKQKTPEEQAHYRVETLKALEDPKAEVPLADKLKVHEVISTLWQSNDALARDCQHRQPLAGPCPRAERRRRARLCRGVRSARA